MLTPKPTRGVAVVVVMLMVLLILSFTGAAGLLTKQNYTDTAHREKLMQARYLARAGSATAMHELTMDPTWAPSQAFPYKKILNTDLGLGFDIWLDGVNHNSATAVTTPSGEVLQRGQATVQVVPVVGGVRMNSAFAGGEQIIRLLKPPTFFDHALFSAHPGETLFLANTASTIMSYDSSIGPPPADVVNAIAPVNTSATVRGLQNIKGQGTTILGHAVLPSGSSLFFSTGSATDPEVRLDEAYPMAQYDAPPGTSDLAVAPVPDGTGYLAPGAYTDLTVPAGNTLRLEYGGKYYFYDIVNLGDGVTVELQGDVANGPAQIYAHYLGVGNSCTLNVDVLSLATVPPRPGLLQYYGTYQVGCAEPRLDIGQDCQVAMVSSIPNGRLLVDKGSTVYGSQIFRRAQIFDNTTFYYDLSLRGQPQNAECHWIVVGQSNL